MSNEELIEMVLETLLEVEASKLQLCQTVQQAQHLRLTSQHLIDQAQLLCEEAKALQEQSRRVSNKLKLSQTISLCSPPHYHPN
jgi:hypothetical protein